MYTRSSLANMISIGDPAFTYNYDLYFPSIPGSADTRDLTFKCQSTDLPGFGVEVADVMAHGIKLPYAGAATFTQTLSVTFTESITWSVRDKLRKWKDSMRNWRTNKGLLSSQYMVDPQLVLWDDTPNVVRTIQIYRLFLETFQEIQLDGGNGNTIVTAQATFRYTDHEDI